jgi:RNA polymerase sigma-54 factor
MRLELGMENRLALQQKLVLAPQIIQSIEILQLPSMNLLEYVEQQLVENEALEVDTPDESPPEERNGEASSTDAEPSDTDKLLEFVPEEFVPEDWEELRTRRRSADERDPKLEALANTAGRDATLQDKLSAQLLLVEAPRRLLDLARLLVYSLDDQGYLRPHRYVQPLLAAMDADGALTRPLTEVVASVDGVAAVKVPEARRGVTPEQVAEARETRDRNTQEAQQVLSLVDRIRSQPGGEQLSARELCLRYPLAEVLEREEGRWTLAEAEQALAIVQGLEPRGVGGRTVEETLVLQVDPDDLLFVEKRRLLEEHLEDLMKNRLQKVARDMGLDLEEVMMLIEELHGLHPAPGARLSPSAAQLVYPDVVVEDAEGGGFQVELVNSYLPPLTVRQDYVKLMNDRDTAPDVREHARKRVEGARWLIDAIQQRQATLTRVAERIFDHQRGYLDHGDLGLRPLKMQTVADELGIHVSTVSRAIADKWVQTPRGIVPLKFFFTGGTETASGGVESRLNVKNRVKEIIDREDPSHPVSDDEVAEQLKVQGLEVARRTVTKYRKQLGIASSRQRRDWSLRG